MCERIHQNGQDHDHVKQETKKHHKPKKNHEHEDVTNLKREENRLMINCKAHP